MSQYKGSLKRAVALKYDEENTVAPVVVATGMGHMAERIVEAAVENNVPVFEDSSLSSILSRLELGAEIPDEVFQAVVDIYVYFLRYVPKSISLPEAEAAQPASASPLESDLQPGPSPEEFVPFR